jgi:hypothetical protein
MSKSAPGPGPRPGDSSLITWVAGVITAITAIGLVGCHAGREIATPARPAASAAISVTPPPPSVVASGCTTWQTRPGSVMAVVHVRTTLTVRHTRAPQAGAKGFITVSSIDVVFVSNGAPVGSATQATPQGKAGMVIGNGKADLTATAYRIYLFGRWAPDCQVVRIYWLPGNHS